MGSAYASPWAREDGELLIISSMKYFHADLSFQAPFGRTFESLDSDTYLEYGLTDHITLGGKAVYGTSWLNSSAGSFSESGFSEIEAFAQYEFLRNIKHAGSIRISAGKPAAFQASARNAINNGADIEISALYGRNLIHKPVKVFAAAETGYRKRLGDSADIIRSQLTLGVEPGKRWMFLLETFSTISLRNETAGGADYDILRIQPSVVYRITHRWAVQAGVTEDIASRNLAPGRSYFFGFWSAF